MTPPRPRFAPPRAAQRDCRRTQGGRGDRRAPHAGDPRLEKFLKFYIRLTRRGHLVYTLRMTHEPAHAASTEKDADTVGWTPRDLTPRRSLWRNSTRATSGCWMQRAAGSGWPDR